MKKKFILVAGLIVLAAGCQKNMQQEEPVDRPVLQSPLEGAIEGKIVVYLSDEMRDEFEAATDEDGQVRMESVKSYESVPEELQVISVERHFPKDPRFEKRERESGIDKWYDITFSQDVTLTKAADIVVGLDGIEYAEYMYEDKLADEPIYSFAVTPPFDDPRAVSQWHYQNDGSAWGSKEGSDINLFSAYERFGVYGNPEVIVAIIDGGIAYSHPDLAQNMWINTAELNGQAGVDDDGNGYVDDIYGYNFMYSGAITEQNHGSHVAGTVAAVNNNGTGVIGIAGGNGSADSGVRLMSCQIFDHKNDDSSGDTDKGFKYGADNGAVIAQCSFGYDVKSATYFPAARKAAIDYFIDYAGKDDNGNQVGPMNGGVVIFAAGNDNHNVNAMAGYERVLAVAAIGADSILARVGAFYHDIGKLQRPLFFIENQSYFGVENPHTTLTPRQSKMVITLHTKDGVEMAKNGKIDNVQDAFFSVGFRSRETALRSFKKYIGVLPTDYLRNNVSASEM